MNGLSIHITGIVQGVGFRPFVYNLAQRHHLTGWVRNLPDGRVAAVFEGNREQLKAMLAWCRQGPPYAHVDEVVEDWQPYQGEFADFTIRY
uniref:Acylphosphatase n=1 Tax=Desulfobacca acetoxidans TaxID=60893 RepID=A0A7V4LD89_9BACT